MFWCYWIPAHEGQGFSEGFWMGDCISGLFWGARFCIIQWKEKRSVFPGFRPKLGRSKNGDSYHHRSKPLLKASENQTCTKYAMRSCTVRASPSRSLSRCPLAGIQRLASLRRKAQAGQLAIVSVLEKNHWAHCCAVGQACWQQWCSTGSSYEWSGGVLWLIFKGWGVKWCKPFLSWLCGGRLPFNSLTFLESLSLVCVKQAPEVWKTSIVTFSLISVLSTLERPNRRAFSVWHQEKWEGHETRAPSLRWPKHSGWGRSGWL